MKKTIQPNKLFEPWMFEKSGKGVGKIKKQKTQQTYSMFHRFQGFPRAVR